VRRALWAVLVAVVVLATAVASIAVARPAFGRAIWSPLHAYRWWAAGLSVVAAVVVLGWRFAALLRQSSGSPWREHVLAATAAIEHELDVLPAPRLQTGHDLRHSVGTAVHHHLQAARLPATTRCTSGADGHRVAPCGPSGAESAYEHRRTES
jgi:hypothetical protein